MTSDNSGRVNADLSRYIRPGQAASNAIGRRGNALGAPVARPPGQPGGTSLGRSPSAARREDPAQKKLFFNLPRLKRMVQIDGNGDLRPDQSAEIATMPRVPEHEVVSMNLRMAGPDRSLNVSSSTTAAGELQDLLVDDVASQETNIVEQDERLMRRTPVLDALRVLSNRERHIITERRLKNEPASLQELADHHGISRERIRQIEVRAFVTLRKTVMEGVSARKARIRGSVVSGGPLPIMPAKNHRDFVASGQQALDRSGPPMTLPAAAGAMQSAFA